MHTKFLSGNPKGRDLLEGLGVCGKILLKWVLNKKIVKLWTGFT